MQIRYGAEGDVLEVQFQNKESARKIEVTPLVTVWLDENDNVTDIEVVNASKNADNPDVDLKIYNGEPISLNG